MTTLVFYRRRLDSFLKACFKKTKHFDAGLEQAMRYGLLGKGKRLRPLLVYGAGQALGAPLEKLDRAAVAVECIHAYSLIHDDLPAMDNDDSRRGKPSVHKKFSESMAILAGDALQSLAFEILADNQDSAQIRLLAQAVGKSGMVRGQALDMHYKTHAFLSHTMLYKLHRLKTAALITASLQLGALCGKASDAVFKGFTRFGFYAGLAFQLKDDALDIDIDKDIDKDIDINKDIDKKMLFKNLSHAPFLKKAYACLTPLKTFDLSLLNALKKFFL